MYISQDPLTVFYASQLGASAILAIGCIISILKTRGV